MISVAILVIICFIPETGYSFLFGSNTLSEQEKIKPKHVALIIANYEYEQAPYLDSKKQLSIIAQTLKEQNFKVFRSDNLTRLETEKAVDSFIQYIKNQNELVKGYTVPVDKLETCLLFYSGHAVQSKGNNYLVPIDAGIVEEKQLDSSAINLDLLMFKIRLLNSKINFFIIDASYQNDLFEITKEKQKGLSTTTPYSNTLIAFAASPEQIVKSSGSMSNLFIDSFSVNLKKYDLKNMQLFTKIKEEVERNSHGKQIPWVTLAPDTPVYFSYGNAADLGENHGAKNNKNTFNKKPSDFTDPITGMEFVFIRGGCYWMGDYFLQGRADERPLHSVCLSDFYLAKYEVTQAQWLSILNSNPSYFKTSGNHPVDSVSFQDAQLFIKKINTLTQKNYRLPTEAEWEFACKAGTSNQLYAWGNYHPLIANQKTANISEGKHILNLRTRAFLEEYKDGYPNTSPVGSFYPNVFGIYDLSGNVSEWTTDWFDQDYFKHSPINNPAGAQKGHFRVLKGGSWVDHPVGARCSNRNWSVPSSRKHTNGFRLALDVSKTVSPEQEKPAVLPLINEQGHSIPNSEAVFERGHIYLEVTDDDNNPHSNENIIVEYWDGSRIFARTDKTGIIHIKNLPIGLYRIVFPDNSSLGKDHIEAIVKKEDSYYRFLTN